MKVHKKNKLKDLLIAVLYLEILFFVFILPLAYSFSVIGLILAEMLYIEISYFLSILFRFKENLNKLTVFLFSILNISLVFITSLITLNSVINFVSLFAGIPALVAVLSMRSSNFIKNLEKVNKGVQEYMSHILVIVSFLFLVMSDYVSFTAQTIEQFAICVSFILISGIMGVVYFYEKSDTGKKNELRKALLFSYSSILLLLVFIIISVLFLINLPLSFI